MYASADRGTVEMSCQVILYASSTGLPFSTPFPPHSARPAGSNNPGRKYELLYVAWLYRRQKKRSSLIFCFFFPFPYLTFVRIYFFTFHSSAEIFSNQTKSRNKSMNEMPC